MMSEGLKLCGELCNDADFNKVLSTVSGDIIMLVGIANETLTHDRIRANRPLGTVIYKRAAKSGFFGLGATDAGYEADRIGTDILPPNYMVGSQNGFISSYRSIGSDPDIVAVVIGLSPRIRRMSFTLPNFQNEWLDYAKRVNKPVFLIGTGGDALRTRYIAYQGKYEQLR